MGHQQLIWQGAGSGTLSNPFILLKENQDFDLNLPFNIKIESNFPGSTNKVNYFRINDSSAVYALAIIVKDAKLDFYLKVENAIDHTLLLSEAVDYIDGGFLIFRQNGSSYIVKQQLFSSVDITDLTHALNQKANVIHSHQISDIEELQEELDSKQVTLVAGLNIKTFNGRSLLGSGNIELPLDSEDIDDVPRLTLEGTWQQVNDFDDAQLVDRNIIPLDFEPTVNDLFMVEVEFDESDGQKNKYYPIFTAGANNPANKVIVTTKNESDVEYLYVFYPYFVDRDLILGSPSKLSFTDQVSGELPTTIYTGRVYKLNNDNTNVVKMMTEEELLQSSPSARFVSAELLNSVFAKFTDVATALQPYAKTNDVEDKLDIINNTVSSKADKTVTDSHAARITNVENNKANKTDVHEPDEITLRVNSEGKLEVNKNLELDGGYL